MTPVAEDPAAHITTVRVTTSSLEEMTTVFVGLGADASQSMTHFRFTVRITLEGQGGLVEVHDGSDNSAAPEGGSISVGFTGVTMVFLKHVPAWWKVLVGTFHQQFVDSILGSDTETLTHH